MTTNCRPINARRAEPRQSCRSCPIRRVRTCRDAARFFVGDCLRTSGSPPRTAFCRERLRGKAGDACNQITYRLQQHRVDDHGSEGKGRRQLLRKPLARGRVAVREARCCVAPVRTANCNGCSPRRSACPLNSESARRGRLILASSRGRSRRGMSHRAWTRGACRRECRDRSSSRKPIVVAGVAEQTGGESV